MATRQQNDRSSPSSRQTLGREAEGLVERHLRRQGMVVIARNQVFPGIGELDLVVETADTRCFVEVRCRRSARWGAPEETVDWRKQRKLRQLARLFQERFPSAKPCRFDVAAVLWPPQGRPQLRYIPDAFC